MIYPFVLGTRPLFAIVIVACNTKHFSGMILWGLGRYVPLNHYHQFSTNPHTGANQGSGTLRKFADTDRCPGLGCINRHLVRYVYSQSIITVVRTIDSDSVSGPLMAKRQPVIHMCRKTHGRYNCFWGEGRVIPALWGA